MSRVRVIVEHNYKDFEQYWVRQNFSRNLQVRKAPIALLYKASAILLNLHAFNYNRGQIREQLDVSETSFEVYLVAQ